LVFQVQIFIVQNINYKIFILKSIILTGFLLMFRFTKALLFLLLISVSPLLAQTPQGISYQAVACDANGVELIGQSIKVRATILKDSPNGQALWVETHGGALQTDNFGLFTINIGQGVPASGGTVALFDNIDWGYGNLWLKIELDPTGSSGFAFVGANRIWSVPYALYAKKADIATTASDDLDKDPKNELRDLQWDPITKTLSVVPAGTGSTSIEGIGGELSWDPLTNTLSLVDPVSGSNQSSVVISTGGGGVSQTITYNQVTGEILLSPSGGSINLNDLDKDPTNELRELLVDAAGNLSLVPIGQGSPSVGVGKELKYDPLTGNLSLVPVGQGSASVPVGKELKYDPITSTLTLVPVGQGNNTPLSFDPSSTNELQALLVDPITKELKIVPAGTVGSTASITFPDNSPTNELQQLNYDPLTGTVTLVPQGTNGQTPITFDPSSTNELQTLNWNPATNTLSIAAPNGTSTSITIPAGAGGDPSSTNELQALLIDPTTKELKIVPQGTPGAATNITLPDNSPTNELQDLLWNPITNTISIVPAGTPGAGGNISLTPGAGGGDPSSTNELQALYVDPITHTLSIVPAGTLGSAATIVFPDNSPTNELQQLSFDPNTGMVTLVQQGTGGQTPISFDPSSLNELQTLNWNATTNTLSIAAPNGTSTSINIPAGAGGDPSSTNELQTLSWNPATNTLSIAAPNGTTTSINIPAGAGGDPSSTNELQALLYDPITKEIKIVSQGTAGSGAGAVLPDPSSTNELQQLSFDPNSGTVVLVPQGTGGQTPIAFDPSSTNEIQTLSWNPASNSISIISPNGQTTSISIPAGAGGDPSSTNELQTLSYDGNNTLTMTPSASGAANTIVLNDGDKDKFNEIQTLNFDPTTNKISLSAPPGSGAPVSTITLDDNDKSATNELQSLNFNAVTKELTLFPASATGASSVTISDNDSNPTNELQGLSFDSLSRTISIFPTPPNGAGSIKLALSSPGNNEFPLNCGKTDYLVLLSNYTVPAGKTLFLTAAGEDVTIITPTGTIVHPNSPSMPIITSGMSISNCNCTAYLTTNCTDWTPLFINLNEAQYLTNGFTVPPGKVFVVKSGILINKGELTISIDGGFNWVDIEVALSPYEAASRAPTFPAGTKIRKPANIANMTISGYLFNN
jgi:hypothetical protein